MRRTTLVSWGARVATYLSFVTKLSIEIKCPLLFTSLSSKQEVVLTDTIYLYLVATVTESTNCVISG